MRGTNKILKNNLKKRKKIILTVFGGLFIHPLKWNSEASQLDVSKAQLCPFHASFTRLNNRLFFGLLFFFSKDNKDTFICRV